MRHLKKNEQKIWYALYDERIPVYAKDDEGNVLIDLETGLMLETGRYTNGYEYPVETKINVSPGRADGENEVFGKSVDYDRTLCTTNKALPIESTTLIWLETEPKYKDDGTVDGDSADYQVAATPIISLNSLLIPIKRLEKTRNGKNY